MADLHIITGDCRAALADLPAESVQCVVTSPPYFGLRDYGAEGQIGLEQTPEAYVAELVVVFREVRRVLRPDGTCWLNIGDSYNTQPAGNRNASGFSQTRPSRRTGNGIQETVKTGRGLLHSLKPKDLLMIPARVALALQADGWWLRSDIIWSKPNPMPESTKDRPTQAHEHVFLLTKSDRYFYDAAAIAEDAVGQSHHDLTGGRYAPPGQTKHTGSRANNGRPVNGKRNARNVWMVATRPFLGAHHAVMPLALAERCVLAGSRPGDMVLDPFGGAGTTGLVALRLGRSAMLIELNPAQAELARQRIETDRGQAVPKPRRSKPARCLRHRHRHQ